MDYSTISNKTTFTETDELTNGELSERYYLLKKQFENLTFTYDTLKQELHDAKRNYQIALDTQSHLTVELESYQDEEQKRTKELNNRITSLQEEVCTLREARTEIVEQHAAEKKKLESEIHRLKEEEACRERMSPERDNAELEEAKQALNEALCEASAAKAALQAANEEIVSWKQKTEELINEMGEMRASADLRREELRAAEEREAQVLGQLAEARAMLNTSTSGLQPHAAKGNSIFAEVEDKRQEMAESLIHMKQTNSALRRELASKKAELEALLHEKTAVWDLARGASAHHDQQLIESYEERITQLESICERQRRELCRWFGQLADPTLPGWLPAVLDHLKSECEYLRQEVLTRGAAQLATAAQLRELRRKLARITAAQGRQSNSPANDDATEKDDIKPVQPKMRPIQVTNSDARKKVSFT